ncbi:F-box protein At5g07610-like [Actinidia eriantha]|uniref:F-box protein At5g07610-like n=1 Tax=Actinidia eriantha TaxID=165200 RepID=UPI00258AD998|nr:F-box protein At5g07610-like [Actinidia eriantha]
MRFESGIFWNHAIHWFSEEFVSLCFDVNAENLIEIPMPPISDHDHHWSCRYFGLCGNHLHFIRICQLSAKKFCILEMNRDYSKWFIKYRVSVCCLISAFPEIVLTTSRREFQETIYAFLGLCVVKGLKEEDSALMLRIPGKVISSNFMHKTVKALCKLPGQLTDPVLFNSVSAYPYIETLSLF